MINPLPDEYPYLHTNIDVKAVLASWVHEMSHFHQCYRKLDTLLSDGHKHTNKVHQGQLYIGQCPVGQVEALMNSMNDALQKLFSVAEMVDSFGNDPQKMDYKTIIGHTLILQQLNKEAKASLQLASRPSA